jgi:peptidylprolyl isomerase
MKLMLSSLALLAALTTAASAQTAPHKAATTTHKAATTTTTHHHAATTTAVSHVPRVPGIPKTLYTLKYIDTVVGKGPLAEPHKWYTVRYTGWLTDGTKFDSSDDHPGSAPITFPYGAHRVITGWDTGFEGMHVGGKRRLYVPYQLAYGELGRPPVIPAKANLVFDVELVSMSDTPPAPPAPPAPAPAAKPAAEPAPEASPAPEAKPSAPQPETTPHPQSL